MDPSPFHAPSRVAPAAARKSGASNDAPINTNDAAPQLKLPTELLDESHKQRPEVQQAKQLAKAKQTEQGEEEIDDAAEAESDFVEYAPSKYRGGQPHSMQMRERISRPTRYL